MHLGFEEMFERVLYMPYVVMLYAALLALLFVGLSIRTLRLRRHLKVAVGDGGSNVLLRAMRVHSNFAEYVPIGLLILYFVEATGSKPLLVHILGASLLFGRILHAIGVSQVNEKLLLRVLGMFMTFTPIIVCSVLILFKYLTK